jgi:RHS repeat-associated protein
MKTTFWAGLLFSVVVNLSAQTTGPVDQTASNTDPQATPFTVANRDANSSVWESTTYEQNPSGEATPHIHHFTQIGTGLNHLVNGAWVDSKEEIDVLPNGTAHAIQGQHQAYFPGDIYEGQIELVTPDGEHLKSRPLGLSYFDGQNSVLIAELTNSVGAIVGNNQVIYTNAFTGLKADLRYTYTKNGFEQDIILHERPPTPESFGLNSQTTRLEVLTEFFDPPQPDIQSTAMPEQAGMSLIDQTLGFGQMHMIPGRAFLLGENSTAPTAKVSKSWSLLDGRQFLVEEVPVNAIAGGLATLPMAVLNTGKILQMASRHITLPPQRLARAGTKTMQLSKAPIATKGFVLDYQTVISSLSGGYTFRSDMTYYVGDEVDLENGTVTFEGGTVVKYTNSSSAQIFVFGGTVVCQTGPYHPAVFTSMNDDTVGEIISGSSHSPVNTGATYLSIDCYEGTDPTVLKYLQFKYAGVGLGYGFHSNPCPVTDCQFLNCGTGLSMYNAGGLSGTKPYAVYNDLFSQCTYGVDLTSDGSLIGANITADQVSDFCDFGDVQSYLTNCIFTDVSDVYNVGTLDHCIQESSGSGIYKTIGAASYYLTVNSTNRNAGTTNIAPSVLADLKRGTTYAPIVYSNLTLTTNLTLGPQVQRDNDVLDLGYHYDPLDYAFGGVVVNSNLTFNPGTAIGSFELPGGSGFAIRLSGVGNVQFDGTVTAPCVLARYSTVQEGGTGNWKDKGSLAFVTSASGNTGPVEADAQFTHFFGLVADPNFFAEYFKPLNLQAQNCEFSSASQAAYWMGQYFTNCLFDRVQTVGIHGNFSPEGFCMRNCTMHGGSLQITRQGGSWLAMITNCAFDGVDFSLMDTNATYTFCAYNAFLTPGGRTSVTNVHDVVVTNFNWQSSWLGNYYLPTSSSLINSGSTNADLLGLYHFTTQTNQVKETNSTVDIGYHYVAMDANGNPVDTDGDGIPDYIEDANGNGTVDSGESSWLLGIDTQPQSQNVVEGVDVTFSVVAGGTTPFYYQWWFNGAAISGAANSNFTKQVVMTNDEGNYSVVVTNSTGAVTSSVAVLTVNTNIIITSQPNDATVLQGGTTNFSVGITGNHAIYQWYGNGSPLVDNARVSGSTTTNLTLSSILPTDGGPYYVVVTNLFNSVTSRSATLTVISSPDVTSPPTNTTVIQSDDVALSATVTGETLYFQWWLTNNVGTTNIFGANSESYSKLVVQTNDAGHYSLVITNQAGHTNVNADLNVLVAPWITQEPTSVITNQGSNVTFSISAFGTASLFYQWYKYGTNAIANATNSSLTLNNVQGSDAAGYSVLITNAAGTNFSAWAWLSVILNSGGTNFGWGSGSTNSSTTVLMIGPTNSLPTNPAIYLYGSPISIRASAFNLYNNITNVAFYFTGTNYVTNFLSAGNAVPGSNTTFAVAWTNALHGTNIVKARAWDSYGNTTDSSVVYVIMDAAPTNIVVPTMTSIVWEGYNTNVWFTNYISDDGLPHAVTNFNWTVPLGVTTSNVYIYTSTNLTIATQATFTNSGTYPITLSVTDNFVSTPATCTVKVKHRPVISFNSPTNNAKFLTGVSILLDATAIDPDGGGIAGVAFYDGANFITNGLPSANNKYRRVWSNPSPLWDHTISVIATNSDGLTSSTNVTIAIVPPLDVRFQSPTNTQFFVFSPTNIILSALPTNYAGFPITSVIFSNVTQSINLGAGTLTNGAYQTVWTNLTNGTYSIMVTARDSGGNVASDEVSITVNAMPTVSIISPTNVQSFTEISDVLLKAVASDAEDGTNVSVSFYYTNSLIGNGTHAGGATNTFNWTSRAANYYEVVAVATDSHGASSASQIVVFHVKSTNTPPDVTITYPTNGAVFADGSDITITATTTNHSGSVTNVEFFVDRQSIGSDPDSPYAITECCWKPGTYQLVAVATDDRGSSTISTNVQITISPEVPTGQGFWDPVFHTTNSVDGPNFEPADECGSGLDLDIAASSVVYGGQVYIPSEDSDADGSGDVGVGSVNHWDGTNWIRWGSSDNERVFQCPADFPFQEGYFYGVTVNESGLYVGGYDFTTSQYSVKKWDGTNWTDLGTDTFTPLAFNTTDTYEPRVNPYVRAPRLQFVGPDLYLFGDFTNNVNTNIQFIAKWNANTLAWEQVGALLNAPVYAIAGLQGHLVVGGMFTAAGGDTNANHVAELVNGQWQSLGTGVGGADYSVQHLTNFDAAVFSLAVCNSNLFVGGDFAYAGDQTNANGIAMWDGLHWKKIGGGLVCGNIFVPGSITSYARSPSFDLVNPIVYTISAHGNVIYAGGVFTDAINPSGADVPVASIARATWSENAQEWTWSAMDKGIWTHDSFDHVDTVGFVLTTAILPGSTPEAYDVIVGGQRGIWDQGLHQSSYFYGTSRWRVGYPESPFPPSVTITNPPDGVIYTNVPSDIEIDATADSNYTNNLIVEFFVDGVSIGFGSNVGGDSYQNFWFSPTNGLHIFTAEASDPAGLKTKSKPIFVYITDTNNTVTAVNDNFTLLVNDPATVLNVLTNDSTSSGHPLHVVSVNPALSLAAPSAVGSAKVSPDGTSVIYTPNADTYGTEQYLYGVTDGVSTNAAYITIKVRAKPVAVFQNPPDGKVAATGANVPINGVMLDYDTTLTNFNLYVNGSLLASSAPVNSNYVATPANFFFQFYAGEVSPQTSYAYWTNNWSTNQPGFYTFVATIADANGYSNASSPVTVIVTNSSTATNVLTAAIGNLPVTATTLGTFQYTTVTSGLFDLQGTASDSNTGDTVSYQVLLHPPGDPNTTIANVTQQPRGVDGFHVGRVNNGDLGICDLTTVANGTYDLELIVRGGGAETSTNTTFRLDSQLKIGQFSFSEQDLVLPVNGIPLTVTRTYNSLNPDSGPFGASWSFALNDMDVQLDDERTEVTFGNDNAPFDDEGDTEGDGLPNVVSMRTGGSWDVTLTLPDGRRTTFAFGYDPGLIYHAKWTAPAGVTAKLEAINEEDTEIDLGVSGLSVPVWKGSDLSTGYAPFESQDFPGWVLTTADGTKYKITRGKAQNVYCLDPNGSNQFIAARVYGPPKLTEIDQLSTNKIVINDNGIFNYDPTNALTRWTLFDRDSAGRIIALHDPNGGSNGIPVVKYVYNNDNGNLLQVLKLVDRVAGTYTTNKYHYDNANFPHYITSIERGDGVPVAQNFYDDSGRLTAVQDANGTLTQFNHSTTNKSEVVVDRLGNTNSYVYDLQGNVIWQTNALGQVTATTYSDSNNPTLKTAETNAYGTAQATWTLYAYDSKGNQTNMVFMGHTNLFAYDGSGNLLTQVDPLGNFTQNLYDDAGNLTNSAQYDANSHLVTQSSSIYVNGKLVQTLDANGNTIASFGYDQFGNLTNTTDANGFARGFVYDADGNQTGSSYQWIPPGGGSPTNVTTTTEYDASGRVMQSVDALGNTNSTFYNAIGKVDYTTDKFGNTNSLLYDALGNLIQTTYPNGTVTRTVYDAAGRAYLTTDRNGVTGTRMDYDAAGRATNTVRLTNVVVAISYSGLVAESTVGSAGTPISTNSTVYDAAGRVTSRTSPDGTTSYDYYSDGQLMHLVDALNNTNFYAYDAAGRQTNMVDALNHSTKFQYDAVGRMVATIYNDNTATTNIFDDLGQRTGLVDQAKLLTQFGYNVSGQLTNVIKPSVPDPENGGTPNPKWSYLYDTYGHPTVTIDPKGCGTTNLFDQFSRQFSQRLPMNQTNFAQYNSLGQMTTNYDFIGQRTELRYDQFGRLTNKFYFVTGAHPSNSVSYAYNQLDQVTNITERYGADADAIYAFVEPTHQPTSFSKRVVAYVIGTASRWGGPTIAFALLCGLLTLVPAGRKLRQILVWYCLRGGWRMNVAAVCERRTKRLRLPSIFWRAVTLITIGVLIVDDPSWDNWFNARASCDVPSNSSTFTTRSTNFVYDVDGRLTQVNAPEGVINYTYDLATGRLKSTCTGNSAWDNTYDALGRLAAVHVTMRGGSPVNETNSYAYDAVGNRSSVTLASGLVTTYLYDGLNRLTNMMHKVGSTTNAIYSYKLDTTGRRTNAVEIMAIPSTEGGGYLTNTLSWQFDGMYRLTNEVNLCSAAGASYTNQYAYTLSGNRFTKTTVAGNTVTTTNLYDANDELLREVTKTGTLYTETNNYTYDANGSLVGRTNIAASVNTTTYGYDLMNKLANVALNGTVQASYQYNDQGIRVRGTSGGTTNYYLIDANNQTGYQQVLEEYTALRGTPTRSYVLGDDVLAQTVSGTVSYLLYDGHGSTRQVSGSTGTVTSRYNYDGYGITQTATTSSTAETSFQYCGEQYDSGLGMYNLRARYYSPNNGRFNQRDEFEGSNSDPQSLHKYLFTYCDPINGKDPSGLDLVEEIAVEAIQTILFVMNVLSVVENSVQAIQYGLDAVSYFHDHDYWNGLMAVGAAVIHAGFAALSLVGIKASFMPPPPTGFATALAGGGIGYMWRATVLNPKFGAWILQQLQPAIAGSLAVFASSNDPHKAKWEHRNSNGLRKASGEEESGHFVENPGTLDYNEQLETHTEWKILAQLENVQPGDIITIKGELPPCNPGGRGCFQLMQDFALNHRITIIYVAENVGTWKFPQ